MSDLVNFIRSFSENDRLINAAQEIPASVLRVTVDYEGKGIEIFLSIRGAIPDGNFFISLESELRTALDLSHVRVYLSECSADETHTNVAYRLLPWILSSVSRENPMLRILISESVFEQDGDCIIGRPRHRLDQGLSADFICRAEKFTERYLPRKCRFKLYSENHSDELSEKESIRRHEQSLLNEAVEILRAQKSVTGVSAEDRAPARQPSGTKGNPDTVKSNKPMDPDSWEYKADRVSGEKYNVKNAPKKSSDVLWGRYNPDLPKIEIREMNPSTGLVLFEGYIEVEEMKLTKSGRKVCVNFFATDASGSIPCVCFLTPKDADVFDSAFSSGGYAKLQAEVHYDAKYTRDMCASVEGMIMMNPPEKRMDHSPVKRVELHCHSKMSEKDAVIDVKELIQTAFRMGHPACALTDHGVVQGFPEAAEASRKVSKSGSGKPFKMIYGMEGYLVDDGPCVAYGVENLQESIHGYVSIHLVKTSVIADEESILTIQAAKFVTDGDGKFVYSDSFIETINEISADNDKKEIQAENLFDAISRLSDFIGTLPVCGHDILSDLELLRNGGFDVDIETHLRHRVKFYSTAMNTKAIASLFYPKYADADARDLVRELLPEKAEENHFEACYPGFFLAHIMNHFNIRSASEFNERAGKLPDSQILSRKQKVYHIILLAKNPIGLYHLYRLVSDTHIHYFSHRPRIPKSLLEFYRSGLVIGSACERGEIFTQAYTHYTINNNDYKAACISLAEDEEFLRILRLYDYLEIQPTTNNEFYLRNPASGLHTRKDLEDLNRMIVAVGEQFRLPVCATTDAHFLEKREGEFRKYLLMDMEYKDADIQSDLYFRTTAEMLEEFSYLGEKKAYEVVVENTNRIADCIEPNMKPFPDGTFPPVISTAADEISKITWQAVENLYEFQGKPAPEVASRIQKELDSIIGNGFAIMYYIAYKLVKKSNDDGYIVGSRGSVGSSLVATLCGISEVNPLPPHYRCPQCRYSEFITGNEYGSGYDLPMKNCPHCGTTMVRDGQEIPFETFLGFYGDKQPDIDLNFSSEYQSRAHKYVEELFGKSHTFRAGTIGCFADKNAVAVVSKLCEEAGESLNKAELRRRAKGLVGVKRTTGQHPGGIVVVPTQMDIYEFTPIQYPANKISGGIVTTHFDFNAMHDTILKLDILGHYDPTMLRMLSDLTGVDVKTIPIPDPKVMSLFVSSEALGIVNKSIENTSATLGLSEMGTFMARDMIAETRPGTFFDLVQLMGLSHGTDVWKGNAQELIRNNTCTLGNVIGCRDSIMTYLISKTVPNKAAFDIMERVRKGKGLLPEQEKLMRECSVPDWYIESCKKIKYMFPKAHAAAYAISSLRIAWFKVYYPDEYYCAFFSIRADEFDGDTMCAGIDVVTKRRKELYEGFAKRKPNEKAQYYLYELIEEMISRGIEFVPYDLELSDAERFKKIGKGKILPPLNAITSISTAMAQAICGARETKPFTTREDLQNRSGIGPVALEKLSATGILDHLPNSVQIDLFSLL